MDDTEHEPLSDSPANANPTNPGPDRVSIEPPTIPTDIAKGAAQSSASQDDDIATRVFQFPLNSHAPARSAPLLRRWPV
ncbi:hypothetical protein NUW58_g8741 [Xylaria curta]|uniref:Uncharacterized protein n=1 Tax=Xylaria curta TaxID=42375 RepID=A0ACC1N4G1_9PEZI|nr:hypothetical protein NUW58_g8741 [Xylaria curta]